MPELIATRESCGYELKHGETQLVHAFTRDGDFCEIEGSLALPFLSEGNGALLWRGKAESLFVSLVHGRPRISCDGLSVSEEDALLRELAQNGVLVSVAHEDEAYEASQETPPK
ncbi:MAG: hypothetical protein IPP28_11495 [Xanthomonadales bacterium]|nr:hypothetical protein [Xanthomonadales bacterium]